MNEEQRKQALDALRDIIKLIEEDEMIEFSCSFDFCEQSFRGAARHKGGLPEISQGFMRLYGAPI